MQTADAFCPGLRSLRPAAAALRRGGLGRRLLRRRLRGAARRRRLRRRAGRHDRRRRARAGLGRGRARRTPRPMPRRRGAAQLGGDGRRATPSASPTEDVAGRPGRRDGLGHRRRPGGRRGRGEHGVEPARTVLASDVLAAPPRRPTGLRRPAGSPTRSPSSWSRPPVPRRTAPPRRRRRRGRRPRRRLLGRADRRRGRSSASPPRTTGRRRPPAAPTRPRCGTRPPPRSASCPAPASTCCSTSPRRGARLRLRPRRGRRARPPRRPAVRARHRRLGDRPRARATTSASATPRAGSATAPSRPAPAGPSAYRDLYDVMGVSWGQLGSLNAAQAARLDVLPAAQVQSLTVQSAAPPPRWRRSPGRAGTRARAADRRRRRRLLARVPDAHRPGRLARRRQPLPAWTPACCCARPGRTCPTPRCCWTARRPRAAGWTPTCRPRSRWASAVPVSGGDFSVVVRSVSAAGAVVDVVPAAAPTAGDARARPPRPGRRHADDRSRGAAARPPRRPRPPSPRWPSRRPQVRTAAPPPWSRRSDTGGGGRPGGRVARWRRSGCSSSASGVGRAAPADSPRRAHRCEPAPADVPMR